MSYRKLAPFALVFAVACGGAGSDEAAMTDEMTEEAQEYAAGATDAAAVEAAAAVADYWETHFNMGHASMVASKLADDAIYWTSNGSMMFGREAIEAQMQGMMDEASPQMDIQVDETIVTGDFAVMRGTYTMEVTMDGGTMANTGYWVSLQENVDGEWMTHGVVGNMDSADQTAMPGQSMDMPDGGMGAELLQERLDYYVTHFNMGHPEMVASTYAEDAVVMGSGQEMRMGRAAAEARLTEMTEAGMQIESLDIFRAREIGGGYLTAAGTYTMATPDGTVSGHFGALYERADDGTPMMKWLLTGNHPSGM